MFMMFVICAFGIYPEPIWAQAPWARSRALRYGTIGFLKKTNPGKSEIWDPDATERQEMAIDAIRDMYRR